MNTVLNIAKDVATSIKDNRYDLIITNGKTLSSLYNAKNIIDNQLYILKLKENGDLDTYYQLNKF